MNLKRLNKIKKQFPVMLFSLFDKKTPVTAKAAALLTLLYVFSPVDFVPDFLPFTGIVDDAFLLYIMSNLTTKMIPKQVWYDNEIKSKEFLRNIFMKNFNNN